VLRIKIGPAFDNSETQNIFIIDQDKAIRKEVKFGLKGADFIEIISGMDVGTEVITSDVASFRHMKEIEIIK
jgi:HlyD family secretion protein